MSLASSEADDNGFPILRRDINDDSMRMVGYIGSNELEHALSTFHFPSPFLPLLKQVVQTWCQMIAKKKYISTPLMHTHLLLLPCRLC